MRLKVLGRSESCFTVEHHATRPSRHGTTLSGFRSPDQGDGGGRGSAPSAVQAEPRKCAERKPGAEKQKMSYHHCFNPLTYSSQELPDSSISVKFLKSVWLLFQ